MGPTFSGPLVYSTVKGGVGGGSLSSSCTAGARQLDPTTAKKNGEALHVPSHLQDTEGEESKAHGRA